MKAWSALATMLAVTLAAGACDRVVRMDVESDAAGSSPPPLTNPIGPLPGNLEWNEEDRNPHGDSLAIVQEGRELFVAYNCYGCHGGRGGGGMGPSLRDEEWHYGGKAQDIFASISEGRQHGMPAWGAMLPADVVWKMTAYIQSLRSEREPERPRNGQ